ncbi:MAG: hypothetical protein ACAH95_17475 [Fimbriimonas sp.]
MKLSPLTIYIIGIALALPAIAWGLFFNKMPNDAETAMFESAKAANDVEAGKMNAAKKRVETAKDMIKAKAAEWNAISATRTPPASLAMGGITLAQNAFQLTVDTRKYRNSLQRAVNAQLRKGGVKVINGPLVPIPDANAPANSLLASFYNYPAAGFPVVIFDLGAVTVQGDYNSIMSHLRAYKNMPRYLAVTDGLRLDGTSPNLTATYNLTIVGFIKTNVVYGQAPEGSSGAGAGGAPGAGGVGFGRRGGPSGGAPAGGFGPSGGSRGGGGGAPAGNL